MARDICFRCSAEATRDRHPSGFTEVNLSVPFVGIRERHVLSRLGNWWQANLGTGTLQCCLVISAAQDCLQLQEEGGQEDIIIMANPKKGQPSFL